jgi:hypothetical protein
MGLSPRVGQFRMQRADLAGWGQLVWKSARARMKNCSAKRISGLTEGSGAGDGPVCVFLCFPLVFIFIEHTFLLKEKQNYCEMEKKDRVLCGINMKKMQLGRFIIEKK